MAGGYYISTRVLREAFNQVRERQRPEDLEKFDAFRQEVVIALARGVHEDPQAFFDLIVLNLRTYRPRG